MKYLKIILDRLFRRKSRLTLNSGKEFESWLGI